MIRRLHKTDLPLLEPFMRQEQEAMEIPEWDFMNRWQERAAEFERGDAIILGAFIPPPGFKTSSGRIVGICFIVPGTKSSNSHVGTLRLDVERHYRHGGVGSQLLSEALRLADEAGIVRIVATPYDRFDKSLNESLVFFSRHGFVLEGTARKAARLANGDLVDVFQMALVKD